LIYRIFNRITKEWWQGEANSAQEACKRAGWMIGNCWIREYTDRGGWKNCKEALKENSHGQEEQR